METLVRCEYVRSNLAKIDRWNRSAREWEEVKMSDLKIGDVFRHESFGEKPWLAFSDAYPSPSTPGVYTVDCKEMLPDNVIKTFGMEEN